MNVLRSPYPHFGGKSRVVPVVWRAFGADIPNAIDPFFGSGAFLLGRPGGAGKIETANDYFGAIPNFWRAIQHDPLAVAHWCDWPVSELDMHARHRWLIARFREIKEQLRSDPEFYDAQAAGWWVHGACCWIGGGWCHDPEADGRQPSSKVPKLDGIGKGVHSNAGSTPSDQLPDMAVPARARTTGRGVLALPEKLPHLAVKADGACAGRGILSDAAVHAFSPGRLPALSSAGQGVHLPSLGNDRGIHGVSARGHTDLANSLETEIVAGRAPPAFAWFLALSERLRRVRVACGDWTRVLGDSVLGKGKNVGGRRPCAVFLDAPYGHEFRDPYLYSEDDPAISAQVREWALEHGDDPELRIALCGYWEEHASLMPPTWTAHRWKGSRGYAGADNQNRHSETIWFSPHCLPLEEAPRQRSLFGGAA